MFQFTQETAVSCKCRRDLIDNLAEGGTLTTLSTVLTLLEDVTPRGPK